MKKSPAVLKAPRSPALVNPPEEPLFGEFINSASDRSLLRYFEEVRSKYLYTSNLGLALDDNDRDRDGKPVPLNNLFVPPLVSTGPLKPEDLIRAEEEKSELHLEEVYQVLRHHPRLFILGTPGSGKTTLVQWLLLALTSSSDNHVKGALGSVIPFSLILRELRLQGIRSWDDLWWVFAERTGLTVDQQLTEALQKTGQAIFLIDGLDEIADPATRKGLGQAILDGMNRSPRCRFLITSRIVGFSRDEFFNLDRATTLTQAARKVLEERLDRLERPGGLERAEFMRGEEVQGASQRDQLAVTYLAPFRIDQIRRLVTNWYTQYEPNAAIHAERIADLMARIEKNDGLGQLSRIPVLLNMICFIHGRRARLPDGRAELYQRIAQTYLVSLDQARGLGFQGQEVNVDYQDLSNWLAALALAMQQRRNGVDETIHATRAEVEAILLQGLAEKGVVATQCGDHCRFILEYIVKRSGFLVPVGRKEGEEVYAFNHLSFQEYFAAQALNEQISFFTKASEWQAIRASLDQPHWLETLVLLFELQPSVKKTDHLARSLFGEELQHLRSKGRRKKTDPQDLSGGWLLAAHIAMDTAVRLGREWRDRLIAGGWQAVLPAITEPKAVSRGLLAPEQNNRSPQVAALLFQDQFNSLARFKQLFAEQKSLSLVGALIRETSSLSTLANLEWLYLSDTPVSDIGTLTVLTNLRRLELNNTPVSDVSSLATLTNLRWLELNNTPVSDVSSLAALTNLQGLGLSNTPVSDVSSLAALTNLQWLSLSNAPVSDVSSLAALTNLQWLFLNNTLVSDVSSLAALTNLQWFGLNNTLVSDVSSLAALTNLQLLFLGNTSVSDVSSLAVLTNLHQLDLSNTPVSDVSSMNQLKKLKIIQ